MARGKLPQCGLVRDHLGRWLMGFTTKVGSTDSFAAELWGLRKGLQLCKGKGFSRIIVELDSEAVVAVMRRGLNPGDTTSTLIMDCMCLANSFDSVVFNHTFKGRECLR